MLVKTQKARVGTLKYLIGIGSNLGDREKNIEQALSSLEDCGVLLSRSSLYENPALLHPDNPEPQPDFLNAVVEIKSDLSPEELLEELQSVEEKLGRVRSQSPWQARTIDLDIIASEKLVLDKDRLKIPHPEMQKRLFVLEPLAEICPDWVHPISGKSINELISSIK